MGCAIASGAWLSDRIFIVDNQGVIRYKNILEEASCWSPTTRWDGNQEDQVMNAGASRIHECNKKVSERFVRRRLIGEYSGPDVLCLPWKTQSKREAVLTPRRDDESHNAVTGAGLTSSSGEHGDTRSLSAWLRRRSAAACVGAGPSMRS